MNETTLFLGQIIGPVMVIYGLSFLVRKEAYQKLMSEAQKIDSMSLLLAGMSALIIGLAMVIKHNTWGNPVEIIISLLGWMSLVKGLTLAFMPSSMIKLSNNMMKYLTVSAAVFMGVGLYMSYMTYLT